MSGKGLSRVEQNGMQALGTRIIEYFPNEPNDRQGFLVSQGSTTRRFGWS